MPYLDDVLVELTENVFDPETDVKELIGDDQPGGGDTFALEVAEARLVYVLDWKKVRSFIRWVLGFSYADREAPFRLRRENPQVHPKYPWLTAGNVHLSAVAPKSNEESGEPENAPNYPAVFTSEGIKKTGFYDSVYATVTFVDRPWTFRPDGFVTSYRSELERNVYFDPVPSVDLIQAEGGTAQLKWNQTGAGGPTVGEVIANLFSTKVAKCVYTMNWMWVAESYLSDDQDPMFFPKNVLKCVTKVNSTMLGRRPAGTMLALAPQLQRFRFPVSTFDGLYPFFGWNVRLPLVYFNPDKGVADPDQTNDLVPRGHRLMPWRQNLLWYEAVREDGKTHLLLETDLHEMFRHVNDPAALP